MNVDDIIDEFGLWLRRQLAQLQVTQSPATGAGQPPVQQDTSATAVVQTTPAQRPVVEQSAAQEASTTNQESETNVPVAPDPAPSGDVVTLADDEHGLAPGVEATTEGVNAAPAATTSTPDVTAIVEAAVAKALKDAGVS